MNEIEVRLTGHARGGSDGDRSSFWEVVGFGVTQLLSHTKSDEEPWDGDKETSPENELMLALTNVNRSNLP